VSLQSPECILDSHVALEQSAEFERSEVDVPQAIIDLFQADIFTGTGDRDIYPAFTPANAAVGADIAHLKAIRVFKRR
jgi:hypothetical protein